MSWPCELDSSLIILSRHRKSGFEQEAWGPPAVCRQTEIVFLWLGGNQWGEGIPGPGWPFGRRSVVRVLPSPQPGLSRLPEAAVLPQPSPVFQLGSSSPSPLLSKPCRQHPRSSPTTQTSRPYVKTGEEPSK